MKKLLAAAAAVSLLSIAAPASAGVYGSLGYSMIDFDSMDVEFDAVTGRLGWASDEQIFGFEGEFSFGVGKEPLTPTSSVKMTSNIAGYATANFNVSDQFTLIGRVGWTVMRFELTPGTDNTVDGPAVGVGAQFNISDRDAIRGDFTYRDFDDDLSDTVNDFSISYVRRFGG